MTAIPHQWWYTWPLLQLLPPAPRTRTARAAGGWSRCSASCYSSPPRWRGRWARIQWTPSENPLLLICTNLKLYLPVRGGGPGEEGVPQAECGRGMPWGPRTGGQVLPRGPKTGVQVLPPGPRTGVQVLLRGPRAEGQVFPRWSWCSWHLCNLLYWHRADITLIKLSVTNGPQTSIIWPWVDYSMNKATRWRTHCNFYGW